MMKFLILEVMVAKARSLSSMMISSFFYIIHFYITNEPCNLWHLRQQLALFNTLVLFITLMIQDGG